MAYKDRAFEWDAEKSEACRSRRGLEFGAVVPAFADPRRVVLRDERVDYGEERSILYGRIGGRLHVIIFTERGSRVRIISARKANARERRQHDDG